MVDIQILSDLHLEFERGEDPLYTFDFPACAPNLALLGDIGWTRDERLFVWLEFQLTRFERVFFVSGNHEPFIRTLAENETSLEGFASKSVEAREVDKSRGEFIFLNRRRYDIAPDVTILGCTLWAALDQDKLDILSWAVNDFARITNFKPTDYIQAHEADVSWLKGSVETIREEDPAKKVVVFTHHAPTVQGTGNPKYDGGILSSAFATELTTTSWWGPPIVLWAFGHTHWCCNFEKNGVKIFSNQRGYGKGAEGFDETKVISV
ncbi:hypothetical protein CC1G_14215 [Coprinopsis cinerea okayama7|uniref:Calcineurin-like phosphoesterase domain-containing protein n=1 Tax=Coprinopsis cinerea (strain Okayama-7 / 130 / ATCC MYA-4618 / FGSC 9003) TaxID=240176 RepID=D6RL80_COPC7|nr:hypothetical protein CC1G_14215 [Coprinopsis cinerea okayama7\|eukprot:XP_002911682.1 hypothetical protein CC1G_14215 [Coprinopsis cinerea okayama7\